MNRFDIILAHYVYCLLHHSGQGSTLYARLCRITRYFKPSPLFSETRFLSGETDADCALQIYHALVRKRERSDP